MSPAPDHVDGPKVEGLGMLQRPRVHGVSECQKVARTECIVCTGYIACTNSKAGAVVLGVRSASCVTFRGERDFKLTVTVHWDKYRFRTKGHAQNETVLCGAD